MKKDKTKTLSENELPQSFTQSSSPHARSPVTTRSIMLDVIIALTPAFVWGVYMSGARAVLIAAISIFSSVAFELVTEFILRRRVTLTDLSAAVTGLLLAMTLPVTVPLWMPVVAAFFAIVVVKGLFGGLGKNIVNPALAARVFLFSSWQAELSRFPSPAHPVNSLAFTLSEADVISKATPLQTLGSGNMPSATLADMLIGNVGGSIGEVSALLLLLGGIYLLVRRVISWHIPVTYLATVAVLTYLFPQTSTAVNFMLYELLAGGLILGAFFMATDYATSPVTPVGKLIFGTGCGLITVLIRYFGGYTEGVSFAILIMNLFVWYLDVIGMTRRFTAVKEKKNHRL